MGPSVRIKHKITLFFVSIILTLLLPYVALDILLNSHLLPSSYHQYLINKFHGQQKLFIVSGSNSEFGLWAPKVEAELKIPTINMGFHASYPLIYRLYYVKAHAEPGDILPLEYRYIYQISELGPLTKAMFSDAETKRIIADHFKTLTFPLKINVLSQYSFALAKQLFMPNSNKKELLKQYDYYFSHEASRKSFNWYAKNES